MRQHNAEHVVRQVEDGFSVADDGPKVDSVVPDEVTSALPNSLGRDKEILLLLSATYTPCRELAVDLRGSQMELPTTVLVPGAIEFADAIVDLLPPGVQVARDPIATQVADALGIQSTPFAVAVEERRVSGKSYLNSKEDLLDLANQMSEKSSNVMQVSDPTTRR